MNVTDPAVKDAAARTVKGATIAWYGDRYFDFDSPETCSITLEDYAYALAFGSPRWRGQCRLWSTGERVQYVCAEHCWRGAMQLIADGYPASDALAFLMHEADEVPLPDMPGPAKPKLGPQYAALCARISAALNERFRVPSADPNLMKRYDIRLLMTERRDLMGIPEGGIWSNGGSGQTSTEGYEPFERRITPLPPKRAAEAFLDLYRQLGGFEP